MQVISQSIYHVILVTYKQEETIIKNGRRILFKYIWELLKQRNCELFRINGTTNHLHIVFQLQPIIPLDALMKDVLNSTVAFISESRIFPDFAGWQDVYYAFGLSYAAKAKAVENVKMQYEIHQKISFPAELEAYLKEHGLQ
jgi:REP element-mobilizing transposase RayT